MTEVKRKGFWRRLGAGIDTARKVLVNGVFLLVIVFLVATILISRPQVPETAALVVNPSGVVVDQLTAVDPLSAFLQSRDGRETRLADLIESIDRASEDKRIKLLHLQLNDLEHIGISKSQELAAAITRFRRAGKPVVASADYFSQDQYFLALQADEIYLHPMGAVSIEGYGVFRHYFRRALDKLSIEFNVFRVGSFKSALEPFTRDDMSEEDREANIAWLNQLWATYRESVIGRRAISEQDFDAYVNHIDQALARHEGHAAEAARGAGLVDHLFNHIELQDTLAERVGRDRDGDYRQIGFKRYLAATAKPRRKHTDGEVGIIVARGMIMDGEQSPGSVGAETMAEMIGRAYEDPSVRALVLRIDSGGGSAFASEVIRNELQRFKASGKPLVISMGSVAASGGYWIAANADEIWATPTTITGSIGIFGAFPTIDGALDRMGISTDGVGTTDVSGGLRVDRPLNPVVARAIQSSIEHSYRQFLDIVAEGRGMLPEQVSAIAEGRVWTGVDASNLGLVDQLGGLEDAIQSAAELAAMENYGKRLIQPALPFGQQILRNLLSAGVDAGLANAGGQLGWFAPLLIQLQNLGMLRDSRGVYAYCAVCMAP